MGNKKQCCPRCGDVLENVGGEAICLSCTEVKGEYYSCLSASICDFGDEADKILIECPGATLYHPGTDEVAAGVRFHDNDDPSRGYEIVRHPVYGPKHVRRRWVKKEDVHLIRRCQSCQDYTIRMRRKEGPDLYIPSRKGDPRRHFGHDRHNQPHYPRQP